MPIPVPGRVAEALRRSTAQIRSGNRYRQGSGSAVVLTDQQVITNAHVIQEGPLAVESWEGKTVSGFSVENRSRS